MKKILAFIIGMILMVGNIQFVSAENIKNINENEKRQLAALGLMNSFSEDDYITREEFSYIICKLAGSSQNNIEKAAELDLILPYNDGTLAPKDNIRFDEAIRGFIITLGYDVQVETVYGGDYLSLASALGLTDNLGLYADSKINEKQMALLVYRCLETPMMLLNFQGSNGGVYETDEDKTILSERFNVYKGKGIVTANEFSSLSGRKGTIKGSVNIDGYEYLAGETDAEFLLGYYVEFLYQNKDDENTLIWINADSEKNSELFIEGRDIVDYNNMTYTFETEKGEKKEKLQNNSVFIYNGVAAARSKLTKKQMIPEYGEITLIDADRNGEYDTVIIMDYTPSIVDYVNVDKKIIKNQRKVLEYNFENTEGLKIFDNKYKELELKNIKANDCIWVAESLDKKYATILISKETVTGSVTGIKYDDDGNRIIVISGREYYVEKSLDEQYNFKIGNNGLFRLDIVGNIIGYEPMLSDEFTIGYLLKATIDENEEYPLILKILADKDPHNYFCDEKVKLNGKLISDYRVLVNELYETPGSVKKQIIRFKQNAEGKITYIETASDKPTPDGRLFKEGFIPERAKGAGTLFKRDDGGILSNYFALGKDAVVIVVPPDKEDYNSYIYGRPEDLKNDALTYGLTAYKVDDNSDYCVAAVWDDGQAGSNKFSPSGGTRGTLYEISTTIDENNEVVYEVKYYNNGALAIAITDDVELVEELSAGDIIRFTVSNIDGRINAMTRDYDYSENTIPSGLDTSGGYGAEYRISCGTVVKKQKNSVKIDSNNIPTPANTFIDYELLLFDNCKSVTVCEFVRGGKPILRSGTTSEITVGDKIVYTQNWGGPITITVYKD